jgi:hypothetical protein
VQAQWLSRGIALLILSVDTRWAMTGEGRRRESGPVSGVQEVGPMSAMDGCCPGHSKWLFRLRHPFSGNRGQMFRSRDAFGNDERQNAVLIV